MLYEVITRNDGWYGIKVWRQDALNEAFRKVDAAGFNIHTHQIGDAAAAYALDALEYARTVNGPRDSRHTFAHVQMIEKDDIKRMADMGMNAIIRITSYNVCYTKLLRRGL